MQIEYITSNNMWKLLYETIRLMDKATAHHGMRVSYIMSKMLECRGLNEKFEIADFMMLAMLHDVGAFKTDDVKKPLTYEAKVPAPHSVYGYLFLKYLSPLSDMSKMILYHHIDYSRTKDIDYQYKDELEILKVAEIIDVWIRAFGDKFSINMLDRYAGTKYQEEACQLLKQADAEFEIVKKIKDRSYIKEVDEAMEYILLSDDEKEKYLKMLMYCTGLKSENMVSETVATMYVCRELGRKLKQSEMDKNEVYYAALLHDIGMLAMPSKLVDAPRSLNQAEKNFIHTHVEIMEKVLEGKISPDIISIASAHHERCDGSGYPRGLKGNAMSEKQAILQIAENVVHMGMEKPYRRAFTKDEIIKDLNDGIVNDKYDGIIADTMVRNYDEIMEKAFARAQNALVTHQKLQSNYEQVYKSFRY